MQDFLEPLHVHGLTGDNGFNNGQLGKHIDIYENEMPDLEKADIILVGVNETRGNSITNITSAPDIIRKHLYELYYWHNDVRIADLGNVKTGISLNDSYAAVKTILAELLEMKKTVVLLGGSHDITLAQYYAYKERGESIEATCIDAAINLRSESMMRSENFLMEMLTSEPNMVKHYNHIGFQSYLVHPRMLETMDKLRFDCFRVGNVLENIEEMEPVLRNTNMLSFDISAIKNSDAPASLHSPNGLTGVDACSLCRFAGMSDQVSSFGIYGYDPQHDIHDLTAKQIAQMAWYFIDGKSRSKKDSVLSERQAFNEYHCTFTEVETIFLQSKKTSRWWMQLPDGKMIACSYKDYLTASSNEIPERWLRAQERG